MIDEVRFRNEIKSIGFIQVSNLVLKDKRIKNSDFRLYCLLLSYAWSKDFCFPGINKLSKDIFFNQRSVSRILKRLSDLGLITIERRGRAKTNVYWIEDMKDVYGDNEDPRKLSMQCIDNCGLEGTITKIRCNEKTENKLLKNTSNDIGSRMTKGIKSINGAKEKSKESKERKIQRKKYKKTKEKMLKDIENQSDYANKHIKKKADSTILEEEWFIVFANKWPDIIPSKWGVVEKKLVNGLIKNYGFNLVLDVIKYVVNNWEDIITRYKLNGYPNIKLISGFKDAFFPEVQGGRIDSKKEKIESDEYTGDGPDIGW